MIRLVRDLVRPYRWILAIILVCMLAETAMSLAGPWPLKIIIDNVVGSNRLPYWLARSLEHVLGGSSKMHIAALAAMSAVAFAAIGALASYVDNYYTESVGQWVAHDLRMRTYHHLQRLSLRYYDTHRVGSLLSTMMTDIGTIQSFASSATLGILVDLFTIVGMLGLMFWLNWNFGLLAVSVTPVLLILVSRFKKAVKAATKQVRTNQSEIVTVVQQGLESERVVKAFGRQDLEESKLEKVSRETVDSALKARRIKALLSPLMSVLVAACVAVVLWRGASMILSGALTAGVLTILVSYLNKFFKPVQDLAKMTNSIAQTAVGVERIQAILQADTVLPERPDAREPEPPRGQIVFDHVAFGYDPEAPVLRDVSFTIQPGQIVGIVGPTGSGKSTVVSLIPRFYDPTGGKVMMDGVDIREYKVQGLRKYIGFVLQDTVLFYGSVSENIAYGQPGATQEEIIDAARVANADEFIRRMPHGYETLVGDRGLSLSGGQRQRVGIARAIIRAGPILILDEPTSALDAESELEVMGALERLMRGRTVITIAHRLSTIRDADNIIVLKGGVVAEEGSHEQLLARGGVYADLHRAQFDTRSTNAEA
jgi:ABC-type multidrug transport system fused ATPase/permease subunit